MVGSPHNMRNCIKGLLPPQPLSGVMLDLDVLIGLFASDLLLEQRFKETDTDWDMLWTYCSFLLLIL